MGVLTIATAMAGPKETQFWAWFQKNEDTLFHFERDQERIFDALADRMSRVHADLTFEFSSVDEKGKRDFVISAGGIRAAFPAVEKLHEAAPTLPRWNWIKFRPRRSSVSDVEFGGIPVPASSVTYKMYRDGDKIGLVLFFDGYRESEKNAFGQAGYLMLDEALGEYTIETAVGFIEFRAAADDQSRGSHPISELAEHFDEQRSAPQP